MKAAFRGLVRRSSPPTESEQANHDALEKYTDSNVPSLAHLCNSMPNVRFSGFGLDQIMINAGMELPNQDSITNSVSLDSITSGESDHLDSFNQLLDFNNSDAVLSSSDRSEDSFSNSNNLYLYNSTPNKFSPQTFSPFTETSSPSNDDGDDVDQFTTPITRCLNSNVQSGADVGKIRRSKSMSRLFTKRFDSPSPSRPPLPSHSLLKKSSVPNISHKASKNAAPLPKPPREGFIGMAANIRNKSLMRMGSRKAKASKRGPQNDAAEEEHQNPGRQEAERQRQNAADHYELHQEKLLEEKRKIELQEQEQRTRVAEQNVKQRKQREAAEREQLDRLLAEKVSRELEQKRIQEAERRRAQEAEQRRIQEATAARQRQIEKAKEAERAKQMVAEKEAQRLFAIEAAKKQAERREFEKAEQNKMRQLELRRQVEGEDRNARLSARSPPKRAEKSASHENEGQDSFIDSVDDVFDHERSPRSLTATAASLSSGESAETPKTPAEENAGLINENTDKCPRQEGLDKSVLFHEKPASETKPPSQQEWNANEVKPSPTTGSRDAHITFADYPKLAAPVTIQENSYKSARFEFAVTHGIPRTTPAWQPRVYPDASAERNSFRIVQPRGHYQEGSITYGDGWCAHGLADPLLVTSYRRYVCVTKPKVVKVEDVNSAKDDDDNNNNNKASPVDQENETENTSEKKSKDKQDSIEKSNEVGYEQVVMYSKLGELIWTSTTPDVIARLILHLDYTDVKALRQTSQSIRFALGQLAGREIVLTRFLSQVGYRSWQPYKLNPSEPHSPIVYKDPLPLSFADCEAFLLGYDLLSEYHLVGAEFSREPQKVDARFPRIARETTRSYNRVLVRLRMQPSLYVEDGIHQKAPMASMPLPPSDQRSEQTTTTLGQSVLVQSNGGKTLALSNLGSTRSLTQMTPPHSEQLALSWKPGRAAMLRVWVPSKDPKGWLSDVELNKCERELLIADVWRFLKRGDVVWDCAIGDERNEGKYIFDGRYLRDLSFMFDRVGHLPSWVNGFSYPPSYYHNVIRSSSSAEPIVFLDVLPWRDQIVTTMQLVQDEVETFNPQGAKYRISKWLYRAVVNVIPGQIISYEGLEVVDEGWHGRIVFEIEGTAEQAKELISRCAGPAESTQTKAQLLASVMDADGRPRFPPAASPSPTCDAHGNLIETTTPWAVIRARSRPGLIWLRPIDMRERV